MCQSFKIKACVSAFYFNVSTMLKEPAVEGKERFSFSKNKPVNKKSDPRLPSSP